VASACLTACAANDAGDVTNLPEKKITLPEKDMPAAARVGSRFVNEASCPLRRFVRD
jgi:hypothetical protein